MIIFWLLIASLLLIASSFIVYPLWRSVLPARFLFAVVLTVSMTLVSLWLYYQWGSASQLQQTLTRQAFTPETVIANFQRYLATHADDAQAWYLLARVYHSQGAADKAYQAIAMAYQLQPEDDAISEYYWQLAASLQKI
jgi:cytochrome c-type biogenesis protein CcmH/NrfG